MFIFYVYQGFKETGTHFIKHLLGPIWWLAPLMLVVELISHFVRPLSLGLRLANVLKGDHTVVGIFLNLVPIGVPIPFYLMGIFVCVVQAFVFTLLSVVYVSLAIASEEHH
jgi:F-type H+-transporting ATPase subunit a